MAESLPYLTTVGTLGTALDKIKKASKPERFTRDFLNNVLDMRGGSANAIIPFLKKIGFLSSDGTPTDLYEKFRNPANSGKAIAAGMRHGYKPLFKVNESAHTLSASDLKGLVVQVTGEAEDSRVVQQITSTFKKLKDCSDFSAEEPQDSGNDEATGESGNGQLARQDVVRDQHSGLGLNLGYTINLNLPPTKDIEVFNAIFKSLKEHLLTND